METCATKSSLAKGAVALGLLIVLLVPAVGFAGDKGKPSFDLADVQHVRALAKAKRGGLTFDLADSRQNRFIMTRLERAGKTAKNSPHLFQKLAELRAHHEADSFSAPTNKLVSLDRGHILAGMGSDDEVNVEGRALVTTPDGSVYSYVDAMLWENDAGLIGEEWYEEFSQGTDTYVDVYGTKAAISSVVLDSMACDDTGTMTCTYRVATMGRTAYDLDIVHPSDVNSNGPPIEVCLGRFSRHDCDYDLSKTGSKVKMPLHGNIKYSHAISVDESGQPTNKKADIFLALKDDGGGCGSETLPLETSFWDNAWIEKGNEIHWNLAAADFGSKCFRPGEDVGLYIKISLDLVVGSSAVSQDVIVASKDVAEVPRRYQQMERIVFYWGCLAEGTLIRMGDGTTVPIEDVQPNQVALTRQNGSVMTVVNKSVGTEQPPIVRLVDQNERYLLITESHPVMTPDGAILAGDLREGDVVLTENGPSVLKSITREPYGGKVYNLKMGSEVELASNSDRDATTIIANGFIVGDARMQNYYQGEARKRPPTTLANVAPVWREDYLNSLRQAADAEDEAAAD